MMEEKLWRFRPVTGPPEGIRAYYNRVYSGNGMGESDRFYEWILDLLAPSVGEMLADVCCGSGGLMRVAARRGIRCAGIDVSDRALREARSVTPAGRFSTAYGEALPWKDGSFRYLTSLGSLEHYLDPLGGVREMARVLAPGGTCLVMVPNSFYSGDIWRVVRTGVGPDHHQDPQRFATSQEWKALLEEGGLRVTQILRYNKFKWWKSLLPFNLSYCFIYLCARAVKP
ncbi:MAG: class I SAM-dependent methyltransferase [Planctomycetota bacterium]|nr:class I SAM-dependent methyltransferase [Planctomycetota bacterium]